MTKHEEKICPRCQSLFECKEGSITLCQCTTVDLNQNERDYIAQKFEGCLCACCMKGMKREFNNRIQLEKIKKLLRIS